MHSTARAVAEHLEATITGCRDELEATVDRLDAAIALREVFYASAVDLDGSADNAIAAMTADEVAAARYAALVHRAFPEPTTPTKEHHHP